MTSEVLNENVNEMETPSELLNKDSNKENDLSEEASTEEMKSYKKQSTTSPENEQTPDFTGYLIKENSVANMDISTPDLEKGLQVALKTNAALQVDQLKKTIVHSEKEKQVEKLVEVEMDSDVEEVEEDKDDPDFVPKINTSKIQATAVRSTRSRNENTDTIVSVTLPTAIQFSKPAAPKRKRGRPKKIKRNNPQGKRDTILRKKPKLDDNVMSYDRLTILNENIPEHKENIRTVENRKVQTEDKSTNTEECEELGIRFKLIKSITKSELSNDLETPMNCEEDDADAFSSHSGELIIDEDAVDKENEELNDDPQEQPSDGKDIEKSGGDLTETTEGKMAESACLQTLEKINDAASETTLICTEDNEKTEDTVTEITLSTENVENDKAASESVKGDENTAFQAKKNENTTPDSVEQNKNAASEIVEKNENISKQQSTEPIDGLSSEIKHSQSDFEDNWEEISPEKPVNEDKMSKNETSGISRFDHLLKKYSTANANNTKASGSPKGFAKNKQIGMPSQLEYLKMRSYEGPRVFSLREIGMIFVNSKLNLTSFQSLIFYFSIMQNKQTK